MEWLAFRHWRKRLLSLLEGRFIVEAGAGTGKNFPYYAAELEVTAFDLSERMLRHSLGRTHTACIYRAVMDVEMLAFPDRCFDGALASFLFCSVEDPVKGLKELGRVVRPGGQILLLVHVRPAGRFAGPLFDTLNPFVRGLLGPNINRDTVENVRTAGLIIERECNLASDIVKLLVCRTPVAVHNDENSRQ
jgi:phosphatidylethanolamine/phosphatidyl-N-methylethanolamine N-methyltransferase